MGTDCWYVRVFWGWKERGEPSLSICQAPMKSFLLRRLMFLNRCNSEQLQCFHWKNADTLLMIDPLGLTLCSYFANALGFDTLLIQLRLIAIFFCRIKETGNLYFFRNLHLLSFPTIYNLRCFPLKWRAYEFFPRGHPRRSGVTLKTDFSFATQQIAYIFHSQQQEVARGL